MGGLAGGDEAAQTYKNRPAAARQGYLKQQSLQLPVSVPIKHAHAKAVLIDEIQIITTVLDCIQ